MLVVFPLLSLPRPWRLLSMTLNQASAVFKSSFLFVFFTLWKVHVRKERPVGSLGIRGRPRSAQHASVLARRCGCREMLRGFPARGWMQEESSSSRSAEPPTLVCCTNPHSKVDESTQLRPTILEQGAFSPGRTLSTAEAAFNCRSEKPEALVPCSQIQKQLYPGLSSTERL